MCIARTPTIMEANVILLLSFLIIELSELSSNYESTAPKAAIVSAKIKISIKNQKKIESAQKNFQ